MIVEKSACFGGDALGLRIRQLGRARSAGEDEQSHDAR
jgi:hypothetical protein